MNRNKVFADLKPVGDNKKHAFPFDKRDVYSIKAGMLNIGFVMDTIPDSSYDINSVNIIRTDAIQSTPFARMTSNMEYHFVPYSQIFRNFEKIYYERGDQQRNITNEQSSAVSTKIPTFNFKYFFDQTANEFLALRVLQDMYDLARSIYKGWPSPLISSDFSYHNFITGEDDDTFSTALLHQAITTLGSFFGDMSSPTPGTDLLNGSFVLDVHQRPCIEDVLRNFDMLGYGNLEGIFDAAYKGFVANNICLYYFNNTPKDVHNYSYNDVLATYLSRLFRSLSDYRQFGQYLDEFLLDMELNMQSQLYTKLNDPLNGYGLDLNIHPSILRMAAYLKVWSDFYRNSQYDVDTNYAYYFNYDYYTDANGDVDFVKVLQMLKPRYRQWKKDIFTGGYPNAQFGSVAVTNLENPSTIFAADIANQGNPVYVGNGAGGDNAVWYETSDSESNRFNINSGVSALSIRQALAMQKYRETILRAGNRLTSLQRAMFGDNSRYLEDEYSRFLNAYSQNIDFNSVPTTAEGNDRVVGELASNGVSTFGGNGFKFDSHDFGVIIGIQYILPEAEYENYGIDPMVTKSVSSDFYKGAFQNLGLSPVFSFNYNLFESPTSELPIRLNNNVWSYLARYWEYKTQVDKVHGLFYNSQPWHGTFIDGKVGDFANFVTPRPAVLASGQLTLPALYVNPNCIDSIFYVRVDQRQSSDPFKVNMNHTGTMVLPMSVIGLPTI